MSQRIFSGYPRRRTRLLLFWTCVLMLAALLAFTFVQSNYRSAKQNMGALATIVPASAQVADRSWDKALELLEQALMADPQNVRFAQWREWLLMRKNAVTQAQANRDIQMELAYPQEHTQTEVDSTKQGLNRLAQTYDVEVELARAYDMHVEGNSHVARQILEQAWQDALQEGAISNPAQFENWQLKGYDWRLLSVEPNPQVRLILYWQRDNGDGGLPLTLDSNNGLYAFDDRLIQVQTVQNLIASGDMEFSPMVREHPIPYPWQLFPGFLPDPQNAVSTYRESTTGDAMLGLDAANGELLTTFLPLRPGTHYLMVGEMRSSAPGIYMIMENVDGRNEYPASITFPPSSNSQRLAAVLTVKPSLYWPGVYIGPQTGYVGRLEIDNLGMFEIVPPGEK